NEGNFFVDPIMPGSYGASLLNAINTKYAGYPAATPAIVSSHGSVGPVPDCDGFGCPEFFGAPYPPEHGTYYVGTDNGDVPGNDINSALAPYVRGSVGWWDTCHAGANENTAGLNNGYASRWDETAHGTGPFEQAFINIMVDANTSCLTFNSVDTNGDGIISAAEFHAYLRSLYGNTQDFVWKTTSATARPDFSYCTSRGGMAEITSDVMLV